MVFKGDLKMRAHSKFFMAILPPIFSIGCSNSSNNSGTQSPEQTYSTSAQDLLGSYKISNQNLVQEFGVPHNTESSFKEIFQMCMSEIVLSQSQQNTEQAVKNSLVICMRSKQVVHFQVVYFQGTQSVPESNIQNLYAEYLKKSASEGHNQTITQLDNLWGKEWSAQAYKEYKKIKTLNSENSINTEQLNLISGLSISSLVLKQKEESKNKQKFTEGFYKILTEVANSLGRSVFKGTPNISIRNFKIGSNFKVQKLKINLKGVYASELLVRINPQTWIGPMVYVSPSDVRGGILFQSRF
jgi:hypothetical protein